jgi:hypothetical protein
MVSPSRDGFGICVNAVEVGESAYRGDHAHQVEGIAMQNVPTESIEQVDAFGRVQVRQLLAEGGSAKWNPEPYG